MARSRHRPQCMRCMRDDTVYHVPRTWYVVFLWVWVEFSFCSLCRFLLPFHTCEIWLPQVWQDLSRYVAGLLSRQSSSQTKVIDLHKTNLLTMAAAFPHTTLRWILCCFLASCLCARITSAIPPVRWGYPSTLGLARFQLQLVQVL